MSEFVCVCLGLGMTGRIIDEITDNFKIDIGGTEIYEALSICPRDNYLYFGNILISDLYRKIIDEWVEQGLNEEKFNYEASGDVSQLSYEDKIVSSCDDLQEILDKLEEENEEEEKEEYLLTH